MVDGESVTNKSGNQHALLEGSNYILPRGGGEISFSVIYKPSPRGGEQCRIQNLLSEGLSLEFITKNRNHTKIMRETSARSVDNFLFNLFDGIFMSKEGLQSS